MKPNRSKTQFLLTLALIVTVLLAATAISLAAPAESTVAAPAAQTCTVYQPADQDAFIQFEKPTENKGDNNELIVKTESGKLIRSVLQFDITDIPSGATIDSATLELWVKNVNNSNVTIAAHALNSDWNEMSVTWSFPWGTPGGDYGSTVATESFTEGVKDYWADWDVASAVDGWVSGSSSNYGLILEAPVSAQKPEVKFKSSDESSDQPKLTVCWTPGVTIDPDNMAQGNAGVTESYAHTVSVGDFSNEIVTLTAASDQGWTTRIYADANKDGVKDNNTSISQVGPLGPNADTGIVVEIDVPGGAADGVLDITTVTATGQNSGLIDTASDRTLIGSPPAVDGLLESSYTFAGRTDSNSDAPGNLYSLDWDNQCYYAFVVDRSFNDNVYADNDDPYLLLDGWDGHSYGNLDGSDKAWFDISYTGGSYSGLEVDYITESGGAYTVDFFDAPINDAKTSLWWNLNNSGWDGNGPAPEYDGDPVTHSPPYDWNDASGQYWEWHMIYEFSIPKSAMGGACGTVELAGADNSPSKEDDNLAIIGDTVFEDINANGQQDAGEPGIPGVRINLKQGGATIRTTETEPGVSGYYLFGNLEAGTYVVDVDESTLPSAGTWLLTTPPEPATVNVTAGQQRLDVDFGYTRSNPEISIEKTLITAEPIYVGGTVDYTIVIDNTGDSAIATLPLQDYYDPDKLAYASVLSGPAPASAGGGVITWANVLTPPDETDPGESISLTVRFTALAISPSPSPHSAFSLSNALMNSAPTGNAPAATACTAPFDNSVYTDTSDCKCEKPDTMTIRYLGSGPTTITIGGDGSGGPFSNVNTGDTFTIGVSGNEPTFTASGQPEQAIHTSCSAPLYPGWTSRPSGDDKHTQGGPFEVVSFSTGGVPFVLANPGSCTMGSIGDRVIVGNTVPDSGSEQGVSGVTVNLYGGSCPTDRSQLTASSLLDTTTTNGSGVYSFSDLMPGEYCVTVDDGTIPALYTLGTDSPLDAASNGNTVDSCDFGVELVGTGEIGDRVFYDLNNDGLPDNDSNEPGLNGVTVNLSLNGQPFASTMTSGNGDYLFSNLPAGNFTVAVDNATLPAALSLTTGNATHPVTLVDGGSDLGADFGYRGDCNTVFVDGAIDVYDQEASPVADSAACPITGLPSSIGDYVWNDANGNGLQDADEDGNGQDDIVQGLPIPIGDVTINLWSSNGDAQFKPGIDDMFVASQTTAADGSYTFPMLLPGEYWVDVNESTLPGGYEFIPGAESGPEPHLVDLAPGEDYINADFGYAGRGSVTGIVFYDWDESGVQGLGEPGIGLVEVCLWDDVDNDGLFDDTVDTEIACQTTDSQGAYNFTGQLPGKYLVVQTQPPTLQDTTPNVLPVELIVIGPSGSNTDNNFGEITYGSIGDFIFLDPNGNGEQDTGENTGIDNVLVTVTNLSTLEVFSDVSVLGDYLVGGLVPGTYQVEVPAALPGLKLTTPSPKTVTLLFNDVTQTVDSYLDADFGYISPTSVQLVSLAADVTAEGVAVRWETAWEQNQDGFRVWRSSAENGVYKLVSGLIAATNSPAGSQYEWLDAGAKASHGYWYKIESLPDGTLFGPVPGRDDPGESSTSVFIPLVIR